MGSESLVEFGGYLRPRTPSKGKAPQSASMSRQTERWSISVDVEGNELGVAPYRFVVAGLAALLGLSFGLSLFSVSPIMPVIIDEYEINRTTAGLLTSLPFLAHAGFAIPGSMLVGRVGIKKVIAIGCLLGSAPLLSLIADSFALLLALRILYGLGFAVMLPALGPLMMQWFRPKELPLVNGLVIAAASLGVTVSTFVVVPMSEAVGWKTALSVFGSVSLLGAVTWMILGRTRNNVGERESRVSLTGAWRVLRSRNTLLLAAADAGPYALYTAALAWLPTFYHEVHDMSLERAGSLMGILSLSGVVSLLLASALSLRVSRRRPFFMVPGTMVGFAGVATFLLADTDAVYIAVVALGFTSWFYLPVLMTVPMELPGLDPSQVSMTIAMIMTVGGLFTFLSPLTVAALTDLSGSYLPGLALFSVLAWSLGLSGFLLPETGAGRPLPRP